MTQVVNHKGKRLKVGPRGGGYHIYIYVGVCQNYGPFLGTLNIRCRIIIGIPKGTTILTTTHICIYIYIYIYIYVCVYSGLEFRVHIIRIYMDI